MSFVDSRPLLGVDFTSTPSRRKPITVAHGQLAGQVLRLRRVGECACMTDFEALLVAPGPWLGAFDFPFGLPRAFSESLRLGETIDEVIATLRQRCGDRLGFRRMVDHWGNSRPPGRRLVHRRTDLAVPDAKSTSPLQTRYVPVGFMFFEGLSRLVDADVAIPGMRAGDTTRTAVEGYPGRLAHDLIGRRSYKNRGDAERLRAREDIVAALQQGRTRLGLQLQLSSLQQKRLVEDASGDRLDAVLCLMQAAWASRRPGYGLPPDIDPLEGWIVGA
jgi:hypothetical protein